ncbi:MAG: glycosyltransferase [Alphaproteobacteria bacterium]|nr:MAG: glycosyltransferase [Alphaproteobacteria bacterium]
MDDARIAIRDPSLVRVRLTEAGLEGTVAAVIAHGLSAGVLGVTIDGKLARVLLPQAAPDAPDGEQHFQMLWPRQCRDGRTHEIGVVLVGSGGPGQILAQGTLPILPATPVRWHGQLELASVASVSGWLSAPQDPDPALDLVVDGEVIDQIRLSETRPDLVAIGFGAGRTGFRQPMPSARLRAQASVVEVLYQGEALRGSPVMVDPGSNLTLTLQAVEGGVLVSCAGGDLAEVVATMLIDGRESGRAYLTRQPGLRPSHQALVPLTADPAAGPDRVVQARLPGGGFSDPLVVRVPDFLVFVEAVSASGMVGWAVRVDQSQPIDLVVKAGDQMIPAQVEWLYRSDVEGHIGRPAPQCGFKITYHVSPVALPAAVDLVDQTSDCVIATVRLAPSHRVAGEARSHLRRVAAPGLRALDLQAAGTDLLVNSPDVLQTPGLGQRRRQTSVSSPRISVVMPVYGGPTDTATAIESVLAAGGERPFRLIIVDDASPDPLITKYLDALDRRGDPRVTMIRCQTNGGFSRAVNLGMLAAGTDDVVLLNSDTEVQAGWLDRLAAVAASDPTIGTVTPISNNAEICSIPKICQSRAVRRDSWPAEIDRVAAAVNGSAAIDVPVAVGFCMFIRRACLLSVGLFDAETWGRGYGEEVDFCLKADARGWRHVAAPGVFVFHSGGTSFGALKADRLRESGAKIAALYPGFDAWIAHYLSIDPLHAHRRALNLALLRSAIQQPIILHVSHGRGGGTQHYIDLLSEQQKRAGIATVFLLFSDHGRASLIWDLTGDEVGGLFGTRHEETYHADEHARLLADVADLRPEALHLHSPIGIPQQTLSALTAGRLVYASIHDYAWFCPRITMTLPGGFYCGQPPVETCTRCIAAHGADPGVDARMRAHNGDVAGYRAALASVLAQARVVFASSHDGAARLAAVGIDASVAVRAAPEAPAALKPVGSTRVARPGQPRQIATIGALSLIKGAAVLMECARYARELGLPLRFLVFGATEISDRLASLNTVRLLGPYQDSELPTLIQRHQPDIAWFGNQWPETHSYTLSHAFRLGLWPMVTDIGAPAERVRAAGFGAVLPLNATPAEICHRLLAEPLPDPETARTFAQRWRAEHDRVAETDFYAAGADVSRSA